MGAQVYNQTMERLHCPVPPPVKICHRQSPAKTRLTRTKRNLFGAVKSDEVKQIFVTEMQLQEKAKREKWNFDFRRGKPMEGTMQWEQVGVRMVTLTQAAHVLPLADSIAVQRASSASSDDCHSAEELMDERAERGNREVNFVVDSLSRKGSEKRQPKITEYLKERKRRLSSTTTSAKKVRTMLPSSATPGNGIGQQQEEASSSSKN